MKWDKKINVSRHKKEKQTLSLDAIFICGFQGIRLPHEQDVCCKPVHKSQLLFDTWWLGKLKSRDISFFGILWNTKIFNSKLNHNWDFCIWHCLAAKQKKGTWLQTKEKYIQYNWRKRNSQLLSWKFSQGHRTYSVGLTGESNSRFCRIVWSDDSVYRKAKDFGQSEKSCEIL